LHVSGQARGGYIDGLFKKRAIQRVGLVEEGQYLQLAVGEDTFQGNLKAGNEVFDQQRVLLCIALGE